MAPQNQIHKVNFTQQNIKDFEDPKLYEMIKNSYQDKNYYTSKYLHSSDILDNIRHFFPIVKDITLEDFGNHGVTALIHFAQPNLIFTDSNRIFGVLDGGFFEFFDGSSLLSGNVIIDMPNKIDSIQNLSGFFFKVSEKTLTFQMQQIIDFFESKNIEHLTYVPGASRTIIKTYEGKTIYISNTKDISQQLNLYLLIKDKYSGIDKGGTMTDFNKLTEIDLAGLNYVIVKQGNM